MQPQSFDHGELDGLVINTTGVALTKRIVRDAGLRPGDRIIVTGTMGDHGLAIMATRNELALETTLESDVAPVHQLVRRALEVGGDDIDQSITIQVSKCQGSRGKRDVDGDIGELAALRDRQARGPSRCLVTLVLDTAEAPARPGASVRAEGGIVGTVTSADWGHRTGLNLAYAFVAPGSGGYKRCRNPLRLIAATTPETTA